MASDFTQAFLERMRLAGETGAAMDEFALMYARLRAGESGLAPWAEVSAPEPGDVVELDEIRESHSEGPAPLADVAWIVLNGGIGTSMRMEKAKSLLEAREGRTFLDLIGGFALKRRRATGARLPLLFMNTKATSGDTLAALAGLGTTTDGLPPDFLQHSFPRIRDDDLSPYGDSADPAAWAPPGHGDFYSAFDESGALDALLAAGFRYAFVSNADNLGAAPDAAVARWMAARGMEFALEVTPKTLADVKGGALVRRKGRLTLLELAQVEESKAEEFQDIRRFPAFNTNNLWFDLAALKSVAAAKALDLPLIVNRKSVDGTVVIQLETAIGAGISCFAKSAGILVDRNRFAPVKTADDLVVRRSDCYRLGEASPLEPSPLRDPAFGPPAVSLDRRFFTSPEDISLRVPHPLSLLAAKSLTVTGDVRFGAGVVVRGDAAVVNPNPEPLVIPDGAVLGAAS